jgi:biopolymer transport protein ExbD
MSAGVSSGGNSQDVELNLASIIDCFTVLIAFMLASASFISIGILDAGISAAGASASSDKPPEVTVTVEVGLSGAMAVKLAGKVNSNEPLAAKDGKADYPALGRSLASIHAKYKDVAAVTLTADNATEYKDVVKTMEEIRKTIPVVLLGGF